jgi:arylsulfatase A-like enzyme
MLLALVWACAPARTAPEKQKPNVLIVVSDDERIDSNDGTPRLYHWFSSAGQIFSRAYVTTPTCCPSRASIFTGKYVHNHGVMHAGKVKVLDHETTIQYQLSRKGYATGFAGKFLNGWPLMKTPPFFDLSAVGEGYNGALFGVNDGGSRGRSEVKKIRTRYGPRYVFQKGNEYLREWERDDEQPWLMVLSPSTPHEPMTPEAKYEDLDFPWYGNPATKETDRTDKPAYVRRRSYSELTGIAQRESQLRTLRTMDDGFMGIVERLTELKELDNTLVVYISDNGYMWGEHGMIDKGAPYSPSVRVPLYLRGPGVDRGRSDELVANIDIAPTIYEALRLNPTYQVDGKSLLRGPNRRELFLEFLKSSRVTPWRSIVTKNAQYVEYTDGFREYYDLEADPYQLENRPELAPAHLVGELKRATSCKGEACP